MLHLIIIWVFVFVPLYIYDWFCSHLVVCRISPQLYLWSIQCHNMHIKYTIHRNWVSKWVCLFTIYYFLIREVLILVLGTNFLVSSAKLSESCMIGLSFFILITWHLKIDLTLPPIPSTTPTPWQVVENFQIIFFLHWRDKSSINCQMNWFSNFEDGPSDQMISECHYPELVAVNIYHAEILQSLICLCLYSWLSRSLTLFLPCGRQHR